MGYNKLIQNNIAPSAAVRIGVYNSNGNRVGGIEIPEGFKTPSLGNKLYSFGAISDVHLQQETGTTDFQRALQYFNSQVNFVCICGDLTQSGTSGSGSHLEQYKNYVSSYSTIPVYAITGNHDNYTHYGGTIESIIEQYTNYPLYYAITKNTTNAKKRLYANSSISDNDIFIFIGMRDSEDVIFSDDELQWLYDTLEENREKRCFVFQHCFAGKEKDAVCGNAGGLYNNKCWGDGTVTQIFESLMQHYNVVWFHGHSHFKFELQSDLYPYANYDKSRGYHSIHVPSITVPRVNEDANSDGEPDYHIAGSQGYIVDVYEKGIILRGRDFATSKFLPIATYYIDTTPKKVYERTYQDSMGIVNTDPPTINELDTAGWKTNTYLSSGKETNSTDGIGYNYWCTTGFIPIKTTDTVYLKNLLFAKGSDKASYQRINFFDANKNFITGGQVSANNTSYISSVTYYSDNATWASFRTGNTCNGNSLSNLAYFRLCCTYINEDSIITINQPIE